MKLAKRLRKEKVNVDVINFGEEVCMLLSLLYLIARGYEFDWVNVSSGTGLPG